MYRSASLSQPGRSQSNASTPFLEMKAGGHSMLLQLVALTQHSRATTSSSQAVPSQTNCVPLSLMTYSVGHVKLLQFCSAVATAVGTGATAAIATATDIERFRALERLQRPRCLCESAP